MIEFNCFLLSQGVASFAAANRTVSTGWVQTMCYAVFRHLIRLPSSRRCYLIEEKRKLRHLEMK